MYKYIPPHRHEWDYTGTEVSDIDCYTMELKDFIVEALEQTTAHLKAGVVEFDIALFPSADGTVRVTREDKRGLSRIKFSVKLEDQFSKSDTL